MEGGSKDQCGATLKWVDKVKHFGDHLQYNLCEAKEVTMKKSDLIQRVNTSLVGTSRAKHQIYTMFVKLVSKMENSEKSRVSFLVRQCRNLSRSIIEGNFKIICNVLGVEMSTVKTGSGGLLWHAHVSELSDNDKAAIMQTKDLKDVLNGQCDNIGFTLEEVENMMCDICVD